MPCSHESHTAAHFAAASYCRHRVPQAWRVCDEKSATAGSRDPVTPQLICIIDARQAYRPEQGNG